ncbi:MAG: hypothetical protein ACP5LH_01020, partial [Candidatus Micrarchaeia archaeon]
PSGGTSPYSYQWYNDTSGTPNAISGATSNTFSTLAKISCKLPIKIDLSNGQSSATPTPFQQMILLPESDFGGCVQYNNNFADFAFTYTNGTVIPSWIESNDSNTLIIWLKIKKGIPASSSITIYMYTYPGTNLLSSSGTSGIGEAPELSSTYAEYDDGAAVFNNYWNWNWDGGTSALPSTWYNSAPADITLKNGNLWLNVNEITSSQNYAYYTTSVTTPFIFEGDLRSASNSGGSPAITMSEGSSTSEDTLPGGMLTNGYGIDIIGFGPALLSDNNIFDALISSSGYAKIGVINTLPPFPSYGTPITLIWPKTGLEAVEYNYTEAGYFSDSTISLASTEYISFGYNAGSYYATGDFNWVRTRAYPPNGAMPTTTFYQNFYYYVVVKDSATTPTSAQSNIGNYMVQYYYRYPP